MARPYKMSCRACNKYRDVTCPRKDSYDTDEMGYEPCNEFQRKGRTKKENLNKCQNRECRFWTLPEVSGGLENHSDNCLKGVFDRKEKGKDCIFFEKIAAYKPEVCDKKGCLFFSKSSRTKDNCSKGLFNSDECEYIERSSYHIPKNQNPQCKSIPENIIGSKPGEKLPYSVLITKEPTFSDLIKILQVLLTDTGLEITIKPVNK